MVFPAPAGMNRAGSSEIRMLDSVPRASGDEPIGYVAQADVRLCSPRQRG